MSAIGWCGLCGVTLTAEGARRCGCSTLSELAIVTSRVAVLAARTGGLDARQFGRAMRVVAAERRDARGDRRRRAS